MLVKFFKKVYNLMVECTAHNGNNIGSNPIKLTYVYISIIYVSLNKN